MPIWMPIWMEGIKSKIFSWSVGPSSDHGWPSALHTKHIPPLLKYISCLSTALLYKQASAPFPGLRLQMNQGLANTYNMFKFSAFFEVRLLFLKMTAFSNYFSNIFQACYIMLKKSKNLTVYGYKNVICIFYRYNCIDNYFYFHSV